MRYRDFDKPIEVPSAQLKLYYEHLLGEWVNFYDKDDILAYPSKALTKSMTARYAKTYPLTWVTG